MTIYLVGYNEHINYPGPYYNIGRDPEMPDRKPYYPRIACLSPTWPMEGDLEAGWLDEKEYKQAYAHLVMERQKEILAFFRSLSPDEDQTWICYHPRYASEKMEHLGYRQLCHRVLVKKLLTKYAHRDLTVVLR